MPSESKSTHSQSFVIFVAWVLAGYITWWAALYVFSYGISSFTSPVLNSFKSAGYSQFSLILIQHVIFHIADYVLAFIACLILGYITGFKVVWLLGFVCGAITQKMFLAFNMVSAYHQHYESLPHWALSTLQQNAISMLLVLPLLSLLGSLLGGKLKPPSNQSQEF
jgi:hypothetical protein